MTLRSFYVYNHHIKELLGTDLHLFELSVWTQSFALSLISVFVPIILYRAGLSLREVLFFYLLFNAFDVPLNLVARAVVEKFGARVALILAVMSQLVYLLLLYNFHAGPIGLVLIAFFLAFYDSFYWVSHLYIFLQSAHEKQINTDIGVLNIVRLIGGLFAPAIGALVLIYTDQHTLIFFSTFLMFISLLPLFQMHNLKFVPEKKSKSFAEYFKMPLEKFNFLFEAFSALKQEMEDVLWPFFIFFAYNNLREVAYIPILISLAGIFLSYITSKISLRKNVYRLISFGALLIGVVWILRLTFEHSNLVIFGTVFAIAILGIMVDLPMEVSVFERGRRIDSLDTTTYLNLFRMLARGCLYIVLILSVDVFGTAFHIVTWAMFILFAISLFVSYSRKNLSGVEPPEPVELDEEKV